ncbi:[protein release factor]-glutamine N5-methyltransferase [Faunimonas pinastri]|uniref:Release factor glutamine methyltransferase n=1 Tax=Faunimonas pinastri TaxID=1855383 RepID=A0A1H9LSS4_9HYPH|nr:peptide chain release factor N(5)-glutamine methyltransferase [Faunimonas pinastri]SER14368.1 [protein release factor]-glutamine N5-methyltransferase [Faunimonas pinastri]
MTTIGEALAEGRARLAAAGLPTAALDTRLLLCRAAGLDVSAVLSRPDRNLDPASLDLFGEFIARRGRHEPVARILGEREFWGIPFRLNAATLVPRPDTEILVEAALDQLPADRDLDIADLGTGSGAIIVALLHERPRARGVAVDLSEEALQAAGENARAAGVADRLALSHMSFADGPQGLFDAIVSNPPYIRSNDMPGLEREVRDFDPALALDGGMDGLDAYRIITRRAASALKPGGIMALEIGYDQSQEVESLCSEAGLVLVETRRDLAGHPRVVVARQS